MIFCNYQLIENSDEVELIGKYRCSTCGDIKKKPYRANCPEKKALRKTVEQPIITKPDDNWPLEFLKDHPDSTIGEITEGRPSGCGCMDRVNGILNKLIAEGKIEKKIGGLNVYYSLCLGID
jgi:hypothetical protein